ncbi:hypothetical protein [Sediminicola luteus]|uniref:Uncharacterized protein n=1 Tax=Sediminicola luteus TaxID=319238 RepID=A0A2A4G6D2_9FLAO|nr:hypothetical protein [Sediminicola luteus]PCE63991.1 hypothetical protein B7P33_12125 [Sediminicola luteus]
MGSNFRKWGLTLLFLTLLSFKVTALHAYTHEPQEEEHIECTQCVLSLDQHQFGSDLAELTQVEPPLILATFKKPIVSPTPLYVASQDHYIGFGRPPPAFFS